MKPILFTFAFAATLAAQNFIQMSDPQFGMFTKQCISVRGRAKWQALAAPSAIAPPSERDCS